MNNKGQEQFIKHEIKDLYHARFTGWGFMITALVFIVAMVGFSFLTYATVGEQSTNSTIYASFWDMVFGTAKIGDSTFVGRPNLIYILEMVAFFILTIMPVFFKKHIKGALVWISLLLLVLSIMMWFNLMEKTIYRMSFNSSSDANSTREYLLSNTNAGYYILPLLPLILIFIEWLTYAMMEKSINEQLFVDAKIGKKLLNY